MTAFDYGYLSGALAATWIQTASKLGVNSPEARLLEAIRDEFTQAYVNGKTDSFSLDRRNVFLDGVCLATSAVMSNFRGHAMREWPWGPVFHPYSV